MNLEGATVLLTGASRGIGKIIAVELAAHHARLVLTARSEEALNEVAESIRSRGGAAVAIPADVSSHDDRKRLLEAIEAELGPLDVLVNNAGIESIRAFAEMPVQDVTDIVDVNLVAPMLLTRAVLPGMLERKQGHIVNIASVAGKTITPFNSVYSATKHALVGWTHSIRFELRGSGVGASVVCPGFVSEEGLFARWGDETRGRRSGAMTTPDKVSKAVVRAIERDVAEIVVAGPVGKIADVAFAISPSLTAAVGARSPAIQMFRDEQERRKADGTSRTS
ncbi:MAG: SDR family NAD(P)-dependent oxidoreductase [Actinomycetota bacterium]